ncbi:CbiX/SirB N-terminal domain-containing protein, partial [Streptomyces sp. SM14]|uniref:sirohydrochlorin chelatase n=1 Tax=Streptomyces sp. SM14 TaxID=1736045 RepID=UPI0027E3C58E
MTAHTAARTDGTVPLPVPALVAVVPGVPEPRSRDAVTTLLRRVRALRPGLRTEAVWLEERGVRLAATLDRLPAAVLVPLLFTRGPGVKHAIPALLAEAGRRAPVAASLGPHPLLAEALCGRLVESGHRAGDAVVLAAPGSLDPESTAGTQHTADLLSARLGGAPVLPGHLGAGGPSVAEAVAELRRRG